MAGLCLGPCEVCHPCGDDVRGQLIILWPDSLCQLIKCQQEHSNIHTSFLAIKFSQVPKQA